MKYLSLFSGIGGFELGIQQAYDFMCNANTQEGIQRIGDTERQYSERSNICTDGLTCIGYSEIDKYAIKIYERHFPGHNNYGDITKIKTSDGTLPNFDLLVGGFPCQSFSIAGKRRGFNDTRGTLFFEIARIIKTKQPRLLLLENVKGLLSHDKGATFYTIIAALDELGYDIQWQVLNSKNFGVPQNRERVFIVGHLRGTPRPEVFPIGGGSEVYNLSDGQGNAYCLQAGNDKHRGTYVRTENKNGEGFNHPWTGTIRAGASRMNNLVNSIRRLTPTECARLQGFPDDWHKVDGISDTQAYKCLGNAVTVNVVREIMKKIL